MGDPLSDPRAQDLLSADCDEIDGAYRIFATIAAQAHSCVGVMSQISTTPTWSGSAADAAKSSMESLTPKLSQIGDAYATGARALAAYYETVSSDQPQFKALKQQIETTQSTIGSLSGTVQSQSNALSVAHQTKQLTTNPSASAAKTMNSAISNDSAELSATSAQLSSAQSMLSGLQSNAMGLLESFSTARDTVTAALSGAYAHAPQESGWDKFVHGVEHVVGDGISAVVGLGKTAYDDAVALPGDVANVATHLGSAKAWEKLGEDGAVVVGTAALIVGGVATGGSAFGVEGAGMEMVGGVADGLATTSKVVQYGEAGAELADGNYKGAIVDASFAKMGDASNELGVGEKAIGSTESAATGAEKYAAGLGADGATPASAYAGLTSEARQGLDSTGQVPLNSTDADNLVASQKAATQAATRNYNLYGRQLDMAVDKGVKEPAKDYVKSAVGAPAEEPDGSDGSHGSDG